ncbi:GNAT family N-acetyltransferase [Iodobacter sp. CM08]|uniref:GNAT family N-acetyltransferase n=1 Tax=Iodobacter sp. CM08 TaxID=3085902 RepID=UPI002980C66A|nr:GNAT family N-acetyltransferase [Iodobacter sp. CM08]MDW5418718.1 GNAT family N-acetyltransferase [Iodobacter sp. CM08]
MHQLSIEPAKPEDKTLLFRLLQLYFFDSTQWSEEDLQEDGLYECEEEGLLSYFGSDERSRAYILRVDGKPAGLALIDSVQFEGKQISEFADLFVLPKYRRLGLASAATTQIVINSKNPWLFAIFRKDQEAKRYWQASFKRLPFRSVRAADDPAEDQFHLFVVNEQSVPSDVY